MIDGNGKGGAVVVSVVVNHLGKLEFPADFFAHRHADKTFAMNRHKVDVFSRGKLCGADEIAFVFSVRIIGAENDFTLAQIFQGFLY